MFYENDKFAPIIMVNDNLRRGSNKNWKKIGNEKHV